MKRPPNVALTAEESRALRSVLLRSVVHFGHTSAACDHRLTPERGAKLSLDENEVTCSRQGCASAVLRMRRDKEELDMPGMLTPGHLDVDE